MRKRFSTYYIKLLVFSLLLGTLPVIAQGFFSYLKASDIIDKKVIESNKLILQRSHMSVEQLLKSIDSTMLEAANTPIVLDSLQVSLQPKDFVAVTDLSRYLYRLHIFQLGVQSISLISLKHDWLMDNGGVYRTSGMEEGIRHQIEKYLQQKRASSWVLDVPFSVSPPGRNAVDVSPGIMLIQKIPANIGQPTGLAVVRLREGVLNRQLASSKEQGDFMILNESFQVIAHTDPKQVGLELSGSRMIQDILRSNEDEQYVTSTFQDQKVGVAYLRSPYNGWTYLSVVSHNEVVKDSRAIGYITLLTGIAILLLILLFSFLGARKMYSPIQRIYHFLTMAEPKKEEMGDELKLIGSRVQFMAKSNSEMVGQIRTHMHQLKDFFVQKLLRGEISEAAAAERLADFGFPAAWKQLVVISIQIDMMDLTRYREQDYDLLLYSINNIVDELVPADRRFNSTLIDQAQTTITCHQFETKDELKSYMYALSETIQTAVESYLHIKVSVGISRPCRRLEDIPKAYQEALEALTYRIRLGTEAVLYLEDVQPSGEEEQVFRFPRQLEAEIIEAVKSGDREQVPGLIHEFIQELMNEPIRHRDYQIAMVRLLTGILRVAQDLNLPIRKLAIAEKTLFDQFFELHTPEKIEKWFCERIADPIIEMLGERRSVQYRKVSEEIFRMIEEEYDTELTLELCASRLGVHPSYIKRLIRREKGVSFSDYLSQYRLSVAKKWLLETDMKIADIAERLRYNNSQNFIRYFRKLENMTPRQYREHH